MCRLYHHHHHLVLVLGPVLVLSCACDYLSPLLTTVLPFLWHCAYDAYASQRPLNAFINASPWPNSQHLCVAVVVVVVGIVVIYMHTSFCIHDVLLALHSTELTELMLLLPAFRAPYSPSHCADPNVSAEKQRQQRQRHQGITMIIKATGSARSRQGAATDVLACQVGTPRPRLSLRFSPTQPIIKTNARRNLHRTHN